MPVPLGDHELEPVFNGLQELPGLLEVHTVEAVAVEVVDEVPDVDAAILERERVGDDLLDVNAAPEHDAELLALLLAPVQADPHPGRDAAAVGIHVAVDTGRQDESSFYNKIY